MPELMLLSNSFSPGQGALEHAMDALAALFADARQVLFVPYAGSDPDRYTQAMQEVLRGLGVQVIGAHRTANPSRGRPPRDVQRGDDLTPLIQARPRFDSPVR